MISAYITLVIVINFRKSKIHAITDTYCITPNTLAKKIETTARTWRRRVISRACTCLCLACMAVPIFLARVVATPVTTLNLCWVLISHHLQEFIPVCFPISDNQAAAFWKRMICKIFNAVHCLSQSWGDGQKRVWWWLKWCGPGSWYSKKSDIQSEIGSVTVFLHMMQLSFDDLPQREMTSGIVTYHKLLEGDPPILQHGAAAGSDWSGKGKAVHWLKALVHEGELVNFYGKKFCWQGGRWGQRSSDACLLHCAWPCEPVMVT